MTTGITQEWFTTAEAATYAGVSVKTIRRLIAAGKIEASRVTPRSLRISRESLNAHLDANSNRRWVVA